MEKLIKLEILFLDGHRSAARRTEAKSTRGIARIVAAVLKAALESNAEDIDYALRLSTIKVAQKTLRENKINDETLSLAAKAVQLAGAVPRRRTS